MWVLELLFSIKKSKQLPKEWFIIREVVVLVLQRIISYLWNKEIQTYTINVILYKFNESLQKVAIFLQYPISCKTLPKVSEKLAKTLINLCNFSKNQNMTEWKMTPLHIFSKDFSTLQISCFLLKVTWNVESIALRDLVLFT